VNAYDALSMYALTRSSEVRGTWGRMEMVLGKAKAIKHEVIADVAVEVFLDVFPGNTVHTRLPLLLRALSYQIPSSFYLSSTTSHLGTINIRTSMLY